MIARRMRHLRDEGGFALIYTLFVTTLITIAVATTLTVTAPNITASKRSQDVSAAQLAAESGIQDAVAYLTNVPACRSETRICSQALGARSSALGRPGLGTNQSFSWTTGSTATADGYVRVTSTGAEGGVKRTLVADLSLNPSILNYGYYTDYESLSPGDLNSYYVARKIYVSSSTAAGNVTAKGNGSAPETANWNGATTSSSTGYPDTICGQHWYSDSAS